MYGWGVGAGLGWAGLCPATLNLRYILQATLINHLRFGGLGWAGLGWVVAIHRPQLLII